MCCASYVFLRSLNYERAVHMRVEIGGTALRRAVERVAPGRIDTERHRLRRADGGSVDEDVLIETINGKPVAGAQPVVGRGEVQLHNLACLDANFRRLVLPRVLADVDDARGLANPLHASRDLAPLVAGAVLR